MQWLSYSEFQEGSDTFESALVQADYLARFCSGVSWQCAAYEKLHGIEFGIESPRSSWIVEDNGNWLVFAERSNGIFFPFEAAWMFGCPLVGEPTAVTDLLERAAMDFAPRSQMGFVIPGVKADSDMFLNLTSLSEKSKHLQIFDTTDCLVIDLSDGVEGFLERRSRSFRKSLRQIRELPGMEVEDASRDEPAAVLTRIIDLQRRTQKARNGGDIFADPRYREFYETLYLRLFRQGQIRTLFARLGGKDIAYIMGGIWSHIYRGFQMSYDEDYQAYSLGNRLQLENMRRVVGEGVTHYDLGMYSAYKERWADRWEKYQGFFIVL